MKPKWTMKEIQAAMKYSAKGIVFNAYESSIGSHNRFVARTFYAELRRIRKRRIK